MAFFERAASSAFGENFPRENAKIANEKIKFFPPLKKKSWPLAKKSPQTNRRNWPRPSHSPGILRKFSNFFFATKKGKRLN
jgi:hypothetical protein